MATVQTHCRSMEIELVEFDKYLIDQDSSYENFPFTVIQYSRRCELSLLDITMYVQNIAGARLSLMQVQTDGAGPGNGAVVWGDSEPRRIPAGL